MKERPGVPLTLQLNAPEGRGAAGQARALEPVVFRDGDRHSGKLAQPQLGKRLTLAANGSLNGPNDAEDVDFGDVYTAAPSSSISSAPSSREGGGAHVRQGVSRRALRDR